MFLINVRDTLNLIIHILESYYVSILQYVKVKQLNIFKSKHSIMNQRGFINNNYSRHNQPYHLSNSFQQNEISPTFHQDVIRSNQKISFDLEEQFSFDEPTCKQREKYLSVNFTDFDIKGTQSTLSKQLIQQNHFLRDELFKSRQIILQLESEVTLYQEKLRQLEQQQLQEIKDDKNKIINFQIELKKVFLLHKEMENELNQLKQMLRINKINFHKDPPSLLKNKRKKHSKSVQHYPIKQTKINENWHQFSAYQQNTIKDNQHLNKFQELLQSIKAMHFKITGIEVQSLKQLWRWLKNIGYIYSCLRKWKNKIGQIFYSQIHASKMKQLINQIINLID